MSSQGGIDGLSDARAGVRLALDEWDATDLSRIYRCNALIESAISALQQFQSTLLTGGSSTQAGTRLTISELAHDAERMSRVVDACLAFRRGLSLQLGISGLVYCPSGAAVASGSGGDPGGLEA